MRHALQTLLRQDEKLSECLATHKGHSLLYWVSSPRKAAGKFPSAVLSVVSPLPIYDQKGKASFSSTRVQVDIYALGNLQKAADAMTRVEELLGAIQTRAGQAPLKVLDTAFERVEVEGARDMPVTPNPDGVDIYHISGDFVIWHRPHLAVEQ